MQLSRDELIKAYRDMATIRRFEERVQEEFSKGGIPGFVHLYAGEEASAVGVTAAFVCFCESAACLSEGSASRFLFPSACDSMSSNILMRAAARQPSSPSSPNALKAWAKGSRKRRRSNRSRAVLCESSPSMASANT